MSALYLWQISMQHQSLMALMESDDLPPDAIRDTLEALEGELQDKLISCGHVVLNLESAAIAIQNAAAKQQARAERLLKRAENLRAYMLLHAMATGMTKPIETEDFVLRLKNNTPSVIIDNPAFIPMEFKRTPEPEPPPVAVPDKAKIAAVLKADIEVPGAHLHRGQRMEIAI